GHEGAHLQLGGQAHCGTIVRHGRRHVGAGVMRADVAEEAEGPRLIAAFTAAASEAYGAVGTGASGLDLLGAHIRLAEVSDTERVVIPNPSAFVVRERPL